LTGLPATALLVIRPSSLCSFAKRIGLDFA
jgi:hypothetical protein